MIEFIAKLFFGSYKNKLFLNKVKFQTLINNGDCLLDH